MTMDVRPASPWCLALACVMGPSCFLATSSAAWLCSRSPRWELPEKTVSSTVSIAALPGSGGGSPGRQHPVAVLPTPPGSGSSSCRRPLATAVAAPASSRGSSGRRPTCHRVARQVWSCLQWHTEASPRVNLVVDRSVLGERVLIVLCRCLLLATLPPELAGRAGSVSSGLVVLGPLGPSAQLPTARCSSSLPDQPPSSGSCLGQALCW